MKPRLGRLRAALDPILSSQRRVVKPRAALLLGLVLALGTFAGVGWGAEKRGAHASLPSRLACGEERWTVKTLQDRPHLRAVRDVTVKYLVTRPAPASLPETRLPFERNIFRVHAKVWLIRPEEDGDFHVVIRDAAGRTMITEAPSFACTARATQLRRQQMKTARAAVRLCDRATVAGVAFFDFKHGQTGVAPNAIELHPILGFRCSGGSGEAPSPPPTTPSSPTTPTPPKGNCDPSYPTVCIPPPPPDLNCADVPYTNFKVLPPDPHHFDGDKDGIGCEA
jgi:hypothetical protein